MTLLNLATQTEYDDGCVAFRLRLKTDKFVKTLNSNLKLIYRSKAFWWSNKRYRGINIR